MSRPDIEQHIEALEKRREELGEKIRETKKKIGGVEGPMQSWSSHEKQDLEEEALILGQNLERVEAQIAELSALGSSGGGGVVAIGSRIRLSLDGETREFLLTATQSDPARGFLSAQTPLGGAILGRKKGERVVVKLPSGEMVVEVCYHFP